MAERSAPSTIPLGFRVLASLLCWYALSGFTLAFLVMTRRQVTVDWRVLAAAGITLGITTGAAALAVWRGERRSLRWLIASAVAAVLFCLALPLSLRTGEVPARTWRGAIFGAIAFSSFLALAAVYVRMRLDRR
ncbi:MAG TPA: hypothetical protein VJ672_12250 [Gemmatimonadaceae bacterium]|nr:hypothetical protein [Gemmatimonadaceae bacterium]